MTLDTRHEVARLLWRVLDAELRLQLREGTPAGWHLEAPDGEHEPDNFGIVDDAGELRYTVQVFGW